VQPSLVDPSVTRSALEAVDWAFSASTERDLTHDLHPWPAKYIPDIPATAIDLFTSPGDVVLDPFCGCGTTAVEALRVHRSVVAADVNALAALITEAKTVVVSEATRREISAWAGGLKFVASNAEPEWVPPIPNIGYWFDEPVVAQLSALRSAIEDFGQALPFLKVVFSSIIVGVSHQESETRYRRVARDVTPADVVARFRRRLEFGVAMLAQLEKALCGSPATATVMCADARSLANDVADVKADLAVFSPPYPNAFDYHLYHRFRMFWLGMDPRPVKHAEIGAHLKYDAGSSWETDMRASLDQIAAALRPGAHVVCVVGDGIINGEVFPSADILWANAESSGLTPLWRTQRDVSRTRRAFNLSDSRLRSEHVLILQR
jgi:hypothetical protein